MQPRSAFEAQPMGVGVGLASVLSRLSIQISSGGTRTEHVTAVAKFPPTDPQAKELVERVGSFSRECGFYNALTAASSRSPSAPSTSYPSPSPLPAPAVWFSRHDPASGAACILMEDLGRSFVAGDQVVGASAAVARKVVTDVASLHAAFHGDARLAGEWASWLPALDSERMLSFDVPEFNSAWLLWRERYPDAAAAVPAKLRARLDAGAYPEMAAGLLKRLGAGPRTLLHGDLRLDNVMFRVPDSAGDGVTLETRYNDMGDCAAGNGAFDVGYFLSMSVTPEVRRIVERPLVVEYAKAMAAGGVDAKRLESVWDDYRAATGYGLCLAVTLGGSTGLDKATPRKQKLAGVMAERVAAALAETGAEEVLLAAVGGGGGPAAATARSSR